MDRVSHFFCSQIVLNEIANQVFDKIDLVMEFRLYKKRKEQNQQDVE